MLPPWWGPRAYCPAPSSMLCSLPRQVAPAQGMPLSPDPSRPCQVSFSGLTPKCGPHLYSGLSKLWSSRLGPVHGSLDPSSLVCWFSCLSPLLIPSLKGPSPLLPCPNMQVAHGICPLVPAQETDIHAEGRSGSLPIPWLSCPFQALVPRAGCFLHLCSLALLTLGPCVDNRQSRSGLGVAGLLRE